MVSQSIRFDGLPDSLKDKLSGRGKTESSDQNINYGEFWC
jgi:hypothetical protein